VAASLTPRIDALDGDDSNAGPAVAGPSTEETSMLTTVLLGLLQTTWVVDAAAGPGSHFTDLPAAIAAAADGDTILVRAGSYSAFTITAKELAIRGAGVGITIVNGPSQLVLSTPTSGINLFSGMTMHGYLWATNGAKVTLLDCEILGTDAAATGSGALIVSQAEVFALRCRFTGGDAVGPPPSPPFGGAMQGGPAVTVQGGKFGAHDCDITGGSIAGTFAGQGGRNGGWGLAVLDFATARIDSCSIVGGNGSLPISFTSFGGDGVFVRNTSRLQIDNTPADIVASGLGSPLGGAAAIRLTNERFYGPSEVIVHGTLTTTGTIVGPVTLGAPDLPPLTVAATTLPTGETDASQPGERHVRRALPVGAIRPDARVPTQLRIRATAAARRPAARPGQRRVPHRPARSGRPAPVQLRARGDLRRRGALPLLHAVRGVRSERRHPPVQPRRALLLPVTSGSS
jgi:hypothetical protein